MKRTPLPHVQEVNEETKESTEGKNILNYHYLGLCGCVSAYESWRWLGKRITVFV
jgi:hypothetical protein